MDVVSQQGADHQGANGAPLPPSFPAVDPTLVVQHLTEVLQITLGALKEDLERAGSLLSKPKYSETVQRCTRFATESQTALYVQKDVVETEERNGTNGDYGELWYLYTARNASNAVQRSRPTMRTT